MIVKTIVNIVTEKISKTQNIPEKNTEIFYFKYGFNKDSTVSATLSLVFWFLPTLKRK